MGLTSGYIMAAIERLPKHGYQKPWKARGNYLVDMWDAKYANLDRGLQFTLAPRQ
jgi:hypothetical protein